MTTPTNINLIFLVNAIIATTDSCGGRAVVEEDGCEAIASFAGIDRHSGTKRRISAQLKYENNTNNVSLQRRHLPQ